MTVIRRAYGQVETEGKLIWLENIQAALWHSHTVENGILFDGAFLVRVVDLDMDGDSDLVLYTQENQEGLTEHQFTKGMLRMYRSEPNNLDPLFEQWDHDLIHESQSGSFLLEAMEIVDMDQDGRPDVLMAAKRELVYSLTTSIMWYQNPGGNGLGGIVHEIPTQLDGILSVGAIMTP